MLATWAPADWHEPSLPAFPSYRPRRCVSVSGAGNSQKRHVMSLITSYLTASAATTRSLLRVPCYVKLVTCQNQSQDGVRWSGQPGRRFLRLLLRVAAAEERERERTARVRLCRSHGGIFSVHSNYSWRDTFSAPPGLTKATNWLGKNGTKKFMQFHLAAILTPAVRTATLINLVYPLCRKVWQFAWSAANLWRAGTQEVSNDYIACLWNLHDKRNRWLAVPYKCLPKVLKTDVTLMLL